MWLQTEHEIDGIRRVVRVVRIHGLHGRIGILLLVRVLFRHEIFQHSIYVALPRKIRLPDSSLRHRAPARTALVESIQALCDDPQWERMLDVETKNTQVGQVELVVADDSAMEERRWRQRRHGGLRLSGGAGSCRSFSMTAPQLIERNPYTLNAVIINHGRLEISAIFKIQVNSVARKTASVALLGAVARTAHNADCGRTCPGIDSQCLSTWVPRQKVALAGTYPLAADVWEIFPPTCRVAATPLDAVLFSGAHADWPIHVIFACESPKNVPITPLTQLVLLDPDGDAYMARQGARKPPSRTLSVRNL